MSLAAANTEYTSTFTVPADFTPGVSRLRLVCKWNSSGTPVPCESSGFGATYDYTIVLPELYPRVENVEAVLGEASITVIWDAPEEGTPDGYNVYRSGNKLNTALLTTASFTEENITHGVYAYNVTAVYGTKESYAKISNVICNFIACVAPVNLEVDVENHTAKITWENSETMEGTLLGYNIFRNGDKINEELITEKEYLDEELLVGDYEYQVGAVYGHCISELTEVVTVIITPIFCERPISLAVAPDDYTAVLAWEKPANIDGKLLGYNIYRNNEQINESVIPAETYRDEELEEGLYKYQVSAVYEHCEESELTAPVEVTIIGITDYKNTQYSIFPNPTNGTVTIEGKGLDRVELYDVQGRLLAEYKDVKDHLFINVSQYESGTYFVKLFSENNITEVKRLVLIK
jgi:hypothetical protein